MGAYHVHGVGQKASPDGGLCSNGTCVAPQTWGYTVDRCAGASLVLALAAAASRRAVCRWHDGHANGGADGSDPNSPDPLSHAGPDAVAARHAAAT